MRISDDDQTYVMQKTLATGVGFGLSIGLFIMGFLTGVELQYMLPALIPYVLGEWFHKKAMDRLIEAREEDL